jgi:hypothetical protein
VGASASAGTTDGKAPTGTFVGAADGATDPADDTDVPHAARALAASATATARILMFVPPLVVGTAPKPAGTVVVVTR